MNLFLQQMKLRILANIGKLKSGRWPDGWCGGVQLALRTFPRHIERKGAQMEQKNDGCVPLGKIEQLNEEDKIRYLAFLDGLLKSQAEQERFHDFEG